jgi:hypothetical protein
MEEERQMPTVSDHSAVLVVARSAFSTPHYPIIEGAMGKKFDEFMDNWDGWHDWMDHICQQAKEAQATIDKAIEDGMGVGEGATGAPGAYGYLFVVNVTVRPDEDEGEDLEAILRELTDEEWERAKKGSKILE